MSELSPVMKAIKREIERRDLSVQELAYSAGIAFSTLYRNLNGEREPTLTTVEALLAVLKLKLKVTAK
jgi:transcriptional regulator with XRE-family HTH domain